MPLRRPGTPHGVDLSGHDEYAMWDAAYVLGSLSSTERRAFEAHQADCPRCPGAVGVLGGLPALLSQLDRADVAAIDAAYRGAPASSVPDEFRATLLTEVNWRRRRSRVVTWTAGIAAAAVLAIGVLVCAQHHSPASGPAAPQATVLLQSMEQVGTTSLASMVSLRSQQWGTSISMNCVCLAPLNAHHDTLAMVVVGRDGSRTRVATWTANPGRAAAPAGSTSTRVDQIASVQVVSVDDDHVLLERSL